MMVDERKSVFRMLNAPVVASTDWAADKDYTALVRKGIRASQVFYLPSVDIGLKSSGEVPRMPFETTAIIVSAGDEVMIFVFRCVPEILFVCAVFQQGSWKTLPLLGEIDIDGRGRVLGTHVDNQVGEAFEHFAFACGFGAMLADTLCSMLSLRNVKEHEVQSTSKLLTRSDKRVRSYHVLNVDGQLWDRADSAGVNGEGYRSHLRRGHIRRLDDERKTWVRPTYVHGRKEGFITKDYNVTAGQP